MNEKQTVTSEMKANLGKTTAIVFSFDTTGSMNPCIMQVRKQLRDLVESMTQDIPDLKIGLIAHGDYCDGENAVKVLDITNDLEAIMNFINTTPNTSGGDAPECYELALHRARFLSWPDEGGSLVLIGDDEPHTPEYPMNSDKLDWREEIKALNEKKVNVFPLQCLMNKNRTAVNKFWEDVSGASNTPLLFLENFGAESADAVEALAYASAGATLYDAYEKKTAGRMKTSNMAENIGKLKSWTETEKTDELSVQLSQARQRINGVAQEQTRLRDVLIPNVHADQASKYRTEMATLEDEYRVLTRTTLPELEKQVREAQKTVQEALSELSLKWAEKAEKAEETVVVTNEQ